MVMRVRRILRVLPVLVALLAVWPEPADAQTIRGHGPRRHGSSTSGRVVTYYYSPYYYGYPGYGFYGGYHPYYSPYYAPYGYGYGYGSPYYVDRGPQAEVAFLDTDVSPEKASVFLDGEYVGVADNFDGYPRFLAVEPGQHTIRFEAPGRQTVTRRLRVPRGAVVNFDFSLSRGGRKGAVDESDEEIVIPAPPEPPPRADGRAEENDLGKDAGLETDRDDESPGLLRLRVTPSDASVYIDGEFMGTGATLSRLHGSLRLDSGRHTIEVARPGYRSQAREVRLSPGAPLTVEIDLERD
jgi:hypothetical protein